MPDLTELQRLAEGATPAISVAFTPDELDMLVQELEFEHGVPDHEPECPACTATRKLRSALEELKK